MTCMLYSSISIYEYEADTMAMMPCCQQKSDNVASCCSEKGSEEKEKPCDGNCNNKSCKCVSHMLASAFVLDEIDLLHEGIDLPETKEFVLHYEGSISLDFTFIWAPPKIG